MIKCDVIQDLFPLYIDDLASETSRALVDEHMESCPTCRDVLTKMQNGTLTASVNVDAAAKGAFKKMKTKLRNKTILVAIASVLAALTLIYGTFFHTIAVPLNSERISVIVGYDTVIDILFDGNYTGAAIRAEGDALFIGYYGTLFTRLVSAREPLQISVGNNMAVDFGRNSANIPIIEQINRIYYLNFRIIRTDTSDLSGIGESATLIWER